MKSIYCFLLAWLFAVGAYAQTTDSTKRVRVAPAQAPDDRTRPTLRAPLTTRLDEYRNNRDYDYSRDTAPPESPLAKLWAWFIEKISDFFRSKSYNDFWQYVVLVFTAALALWLVWKSEFLGGMFGQSAKNTLGYEAITENIHELDFADLIQKAVEQRNYRLAVRLYYLKTLKQLTDKSLIQWQPTKTNRSYLFELAQSPLYADFEDITQQFEFVWYGDFPVSEQVFGELKAQYQAFLVKL